MFNLEDIRRDELNNMRYIGKNIDITLVDDKYIIYPYVYERKYGYRIKKKEGDELIPIQMKDMSKHEEDLVRSYDVRTYGKSTLMKDINIRNSINLNKDIDFLILPIDVFYKTKCRILKIEGNKSYKKPLIFLNNFEFSYIVDIEKNNNKGNSVTRELYEEELKRYKKLVNKYNNIYLFNEVIDDMNNVVKLYLYKNKNIYEYVYYNTGDVLYKLYENSNLIKIKYKGV